MISCTSPSNKMGARSDALMINKLIFSWIYCNHPTAPIWVCLGRLIACHVQLKQGLIHWSSTDRHFLNRLLLQREVVKEVCLFVGCNGFQALLCVMFSSDALLMDPLIRRYQFKAVQDIIFRAFALLIDWYVGRFQFKPLQKTIHSAIWGASDASIQSTFSDTKRWYI